ncbi:MAG: ATP-binding protein [Bacteroidales bacterium]|nr:ATP-binding protein [Bacteroidales bacterium]
MNDKDKIIGKVSATEKNPSTIDNFYFWTDSQSDNLSPFDVVMVKNLNNNSTTYAVVEEINHVTDSASHFASYISSEFGSLADETSLGSGNTNRLSFSFVKAKVVHNTANRYTPVLHDSPVSLCSADQIRDALGLKGVQNALTCGYMEMYGEKVKVEINDKFLIGPDGAHLNVSGISGLACKTSYTMFLLNALQQKYIAQYKKDIENEEEKPRKIAYIVFNVKGRDLLTLDVPNEKLSNDDKGIYINELGLQPVPFQQVDYYYPYSSKANRQYTQSNADWDDLKQQFDIEKNAKRYFYNFASCRDKLQYLFANEPDPSGTLESIVSYIMDYGHPFGEKVESWTDFYTALSKVTTPGNAVAGTNIALASWKKFARIVRKFNVEELFTDKGFDKFDTPDLVQDIFDNLKHNDVKVIDIAQLDPAIQGFVFGDVIQQVVERMSAKEAETPDQIVIFVDELNKYASTDVPKSSPILRHLLDVAERGRALGIILFSVEQFRSAIHDRVKGNCANSAYGRTNFVEVTKPDYTFFGSIYKNMMTRLAPGDYIINNPALRSLVKIKFPFPTFKSNN